MHPVSWLVALGAAAGAVVGGARVAHTPTRTQRAPRAQRASNDAGAAGDSASGRGATPGAASPSLQHERTPDPDGES